MNRTGGTGWLMESERRLLQLYEVSNGERAVWAEKLTDAHGVARTLLPREDARVRLYDYPDEKTTYCGLFNGQRPTGVLKRAWALTSRGGLMELPIDKARREVDDELAEL